MGDKPRRIPRFGGRNGSLAPPIRIIVVYPGGSRAASRSALREKNYTLYDLSSGKITR